MSLLQIKRGEGGTLEVSITDAATLCGRTESYVWKEMWAVENDGGCAGEHLSSVTWRKKG